MKFFLQRDIALRGLMKNTFCQIVIAILFTGMSFAEKTSAQAVLDRKVTISINEIRLGSALKQLEETARIKFVYSRNLVKVDQKVSLQVTAQKLGVVLDKLLNSNGIAYEAYDDRIVLTSSRPVVSGANVIGAGLNSSLSEAVQFIVSGKVKDSKGEPLIGVSVKLKGESIGASTNANGEYTLNLPDGRGTLVFTYIGYLTQEISVNNQGTINVVLEEDSKSLEEVVVVGYGTQKKSNLTGSVDAISGEKLQNRSATKIDELIKGASPNLQISMSYRGGEPGAESSWNVRGMGSIEGNAVPLVLVDGVEMNIGNVDPESIESVSVLKDASASAIYGSRAPFGVVLITTKKGGKEEMARIQYTNNLSFASPIKLPSMVDALTWATAYNQANANAGLNPVYADEQMERIKGYMAGTFPYEYDPNNPINGIFAGRRNGNANNNWPQLMFKDFSFNQKHNVNVSGGNKNTQYYISAGFLDQDGMYAYGYDLYQRYNFLSNVSSKVTDWLSFNSSLKYAKGKSDYPLGITTVDRDYSFGEFITWAPMTPIYNINGTIQSSMIRQMEDSGRNKTENNDFLITLGTELEPIKGWKTAVSYNHNVETGKNSVNPKPVMVELGTGQFGNIGKPTSGYQSSFSQPKYSLLNVLTSYERTIDNHYFKALAGYEQEEKSYTSLSGSGTNLITTEVPSISTSLGDKTLSDAMWHWATQGVFGRLNYNFQEKYLFEVSARYNGSSRFAKESGLKWGFFPSASAGYNISKEKFWDPIRSYVNNFKIRGSYGSLGNQNVNNYLYLSRIPVQDQLNWIIDAQRPPYAQVPLLISDDLTWETITTLNLGLNAEFLTNRMEVVFDWYNRVTSDMLGPAEELPYVLGATVPRRNNAELSTKGFELVLKWRDKISSKISYNAQLNIGDNRSKILKYKNEKGAINNWYNGKNVGEIWGYQSDGLIQTQGEPMPDQSFIYPTNWGPGDMKYQDLNGDGKINPGSSTLNDHGDLTVIGNTTPRYNLAFSGGINWKGFDFNMFWQGAGKHDYYPHINASMFWGMNRSFGSSTILEDSPALDYWRPANETNLLGPNTNAYFAKPYFTAQTDKNRQTQSRYLLNGAYLRLKNINVGYTIPKSLSDKLLFQKARIYVSGENLLTMSGLPKNLDPETVFAANLSSNTPGIIYPISRYLSFGLNLTF